MPQIWPKNKKLKEFKKHSLVFTQAIGKHKNVFPRVTQFVGHTHRQTKREIERQADICLEIFLLIIWIIWLYIAFITIWSQNLSQNCFQSQRYVCSPCFELPTGQVFVVILWKTICRYARNRFFQEFGHVEAWANILAFLLFPDVYLFIYYWVFVSKPLLCQRVKIICLFWFDKVFGSYMGFFISKQVTKGPRLKMV